MTLREQWDRRAWPRILLAFALNAAFLFVMLRFFAPQWETNDDLLMSKFVDGQLSHKTAYVPFGTSFEKGKKYDVKINIGKNSLYSAPNTTIIP